MANVTEALTGLRAAIDEPKARRKVAFDEYIKPFYEEAKTVCGDAMLFYRNFLLLVRELTAHGFQDEKRIVDHLREQRPKIELMRANMLNDRLHLERLGNVLRATDWTDDRHFKEAIDELVERILNIVREYDGHGSRPKTLLDALDVYSTERTVSEVFGYAGGVQGIILDAERDWAKASQIYEQIRMYVSHDIRPREWGNQINAQTYPPPSIWRRFKRGLARILRILLWVFGLLTAVIAVINGLGDSLNKKFVQTPTIERK